MLQNLNFLFHQPLLTLVLTAVFIILNVLDGHSTYLVIRPDCYHRERNPLARFIFRKLKVPAGIIIFKTVILAIVIPVIAYYAAWDAFTINVVMLVADLLFLWVVRHNYRIYQMQISRLAEWKMPDVQPPNRHQ